MTHVILKSEGHDPKTIELVAQLWREQGYEVTVVPPIAHFLRKKPRLTLLRNYGPRGPSNPPSPHYLALLKPQT